MPWKPRRPRRGRYIPLLIPILDGFDMLGVGITKGYELINTGRLDTVLIGRRRYATRESLERLATPAPPSAVTPTKAEPGGWSGCNPWPGVHEGGAE